jgi:hypothetical protein
VVSRTARFLIAAFDTVAACGIAAYGTARPLVFIPPRELAFDLTTAWLAAAAAGVAAASVALDLAVLAWVALGYLVWLALFASHAFSLVYVALALSLAPVLPRPQRSVAQGLAIAAITTVAIVLARGYIRFA